MIVIIIISIIAVVKSVSYENQCTYMKHT